jgi:hypothetical protein
MSNHNIKGISIRLTWSALEKEQGKYDWDELDAILKQCDFSGKSLIIRVLSGAYCPEWLYKLGCQSFPFSMSETFYGGSTEVNCKMPLPWDETYLRCWESFVRALGDRYRDNPNVWAVQMAGGGWQGEMIMPCNGKEVINRWIEQYGYTEEKIVAAWKEIIDIYRTAFPEPMRLGLSITCPIGRRKHVYAMHEVVSYAGSKGCMAQFNGLSNQGDVSRDDLWRATIRAYGGERGYQCSGEDLEHHELHDRFHRQLAVAVMDGASYIELDRKKAAHYQLQTCIAELAHNETNNVLF